VSAKTGSGLPELIKMVQNVLFEKFESLIVRLPFQQGQLISLFHSLGQVTRIEQERTGVIIYGSLPGRLLAQFKSFIFNPKPEIPEEDLD
jgi:GTPase